MIKVMHVITALRRGGAEHNLKRLLQHLDRDRFSCTVTEFQPGGALRSDIEELGIRVDCANIAKPADVPLGFMRLRSFIAAEQPDVVQTWLYHADVLGTLATLPRTRTRLVWNIRNSGLEESHRLPWRLLVRSSALLSRFVDCIVSNSVAGMEYHQRVGYRPPRWELVPNGWVPARSVPSPLERAAARARFGLAEDAFLVGFPARRARQKDHPTFFAGVRMVGARAPRMRFVLFGAHLDSSALASEPALADAATTGRIIVMGEIKNVEELLPALDCVTLTSSHGEGLPNAVGEAMAAGLPVVATDVGDVRSLVDGAGIVAPARDPRALADAWIRLSELGSEGCISLGERGRRRIAEQYSLDLMVERYQSLYELLVGDKHRNRP
jgi:glycosyltransferase involved in cell wall biosynthesis